jgi:hypothetical protein
VGPTVPLLPSLSNVARRSRVCASLPPCGKTLRPVFCGAGFFLRGSIGTHLIPRAFDQRTAQTL